MIATVASAVTGDYFLQPKYLIFSAPFALLFIADSASALNKRWMKQALAGLAGLLFGIAIVHYWTPSEYGRKENWREAALLLRSDAEHHNLLVTLKENYPLLFYYAPPLRDVRYTVSMPLNRMAEGFLQEAVINPRTVNYLYWDTMQNQLDPQNQLPKVLDQMRGNHTIRQLNPRLKIYSWSRPPK